MNKAHIAALACLLSLPAYADPGKDARYLMREPASMLDLGLYKLQGNVSEIIDGSLTSLGVHAVRVRTLYDYVHDKIRVDLAVAQTLPDARETCRQLVTTVQKWMSSSSVWAEDFMHSGYTQHRQQDAALKTELPEMVVIDASIIPNPIPAAGASMPVATASCSGTLAAPGVALGKP